MSVLLYQMGDQIPSPRIRKGGGKCACEGSGYFYHWQKNCRYKATPRKVKNYYFPIPRNIGQMPVSSLRIAQSLPFYVPRPY